MSRKPIANPLLDVDGDFDPVNLVNPYAYATAGGAFNPLSIPGCVLCLDAGTISASDGDPVATWADQSTEGNDATQATSGNRPLYKTNRVNGLPSVLFDGINDYFSLPLISFPTGISMFFVVRFNSAVKYHALLAKTDTYLGQPFDFRTNNSNTRPFFADTGTIPSNDFGTSAFGVLSATYSGSGSTALIAYDGTVEVSSGSAAWNADTGTTLRIGTRGDGATILDADLAAVLVYNSALGTTDREYIEDGLGAKYGITITH